MLGVSSPSESELATVEQATAPDQASGAVFVVEVIEGPDQGQRFTLDPGSPGPVYRGGGVATVSRTKGDQTAQ